MQALSINKTMNDKPQSNARQLLNGEVDTLLQLLALMDEYGNREQNKQALSLESEAGAGNVYKGERSDVVTSAVQQSAVEEAGKI